MQAGLLKELDSLVKEFVSAGDDKKKAAYAKIEEEVGKLTGSAARLSFYSVCCINAFD